MVQKQIHEVFRVFAEDDVQNPGLFVVDLAPSDSQVVWLVHIALDVVDRRQSAPADELADALHFSFRLENEEDLLADDDVDINFDALFDSLTRFIFAVVLLYEVARVDSDSLTRSRIILLRTENACSTLTLILHPDLLIVVVKAQVELSDHLLLTLSFELRIFADSLLYELWNALDELKEVHGRPPLTLIFLLQFIFIVFARLNLACLFLRLECDDVAQQIPAIG
jgi:hypothetical protein